MAEAVLLMMAVVVAAPALKDPVVVAGAGVAQALVAVAFADAKFPKR